jgi:uncharacterized protein YqjF (DUF2071 family)
MSLRPVLTACWTKLLLLNFPVPVDIIARLAPAGTEPDLHEGQAYVSVIGFRFHAVRLYGLPVPGHTSFPEINLRYYVRRVVGDEVRRGVVFVREIVPRRAVAYTANWLYNENYITRPMRTSLHMQGTTLAPNDTIEYAWRTRRSRSAAPYWNRFAGRVVAPLALPATGSLEQFIVEHYWGYVRGRDGTTREYAVTHEPWQVARADDVVWDCDVPTTYGPPFAEFLDRPPASAFIAAGSPIQVFRGNRLTT